MNSIKMRGVYAAVAGALMFGTAGIAMADTTDDLLKALRDKGVLNQKEYDDFNTSRDTEKVKKLSEIKASFKDGFSWKSGDGAAAFSVNGRIQEDYRSFDLPSSTNTGTAAGVPDGFDLRRAYLTAKGTFYNNVNFELTLDAGGNGVTAKYVWLETVLTPAIKVRFGQFKMPSGLETLTSSRFNDLTERDWVSTLSPSIQKGIMVHGVPLAGVSYMASVSNGSLAYEGGKSASETVSAADGKEYAVRVTANIAQLAGIPDTILHVGGNFSIDTDLPDAGAGSFNLATNARGATFFNFTNTFSNPDVRRYGLETILARGPFKLQSEYGSLQIEPNAGPGTGNTTSDKEITAWYANLSWMVTGESYAEAYKDGLMDRLHPKNDFVDLNAPGSGAIELGLRYSSVDASDFTVATANVVGGAYTRKADSWTGGAKWIMNPNTRFLLNYIHTNFDTPIRVTNTTGLTSEENAINFRAQFDF